MSHKELERWYRLKTIKRAAQFLVLVIVVSSIGAYAVSRFVVGAHGEFFGQDEVGKRVSIINKFTYSSPGPNPWELEAAKAEVTDSLDRVTLTDPKVVYRGNQGREIRLTAKSGELNRKQNTVSARGGVIIRYDNFKIEAGQIGYSDETKLAEAPASVSLKGNDLHLTGKGLKLSVDKEEIVIEQDVTARLFNIKWTDRAGKLPL